MIAFALCFVNFMSLNMIGGRGRDFPTDHDFNAEWSILRNPMKTNFLHTSQIHYRIRDILHIIN